MKQHTQHIYKKYFEGIETVSEKKAMTQMFGKLPPPPKGKKWGKEKQLRISYKCKCGDYQHFYHTPFEKPKMPKILKMKVKILEK